MSKLAHFSASTLGLTTLKKELNKTIQLEIMEAKRIQKEVKCGWTEALKLARIKPL